LIQLLLRALATCSVFFRQYNFETKEMFMKKTYKVFGLVVVLLMLVGALQLTITRPAQAAVGFHISGRNLLDVNNNNFIIRGISHAHVWYPSNTASFADIKNVGKANTIRVVLGGGRWGPNSASDVANVITLCKNNKLVCVLEDHDTTGFGEDGAATSLATAVNYWKSIQSVLTGQEAYVIINIGNEPYGNNNAAAWTQATKDAIIAMRAAGFQHTLMVDAPNWGQDWQFTMRDNAASVLASDTARNTIFSIHMYGVFDTAAEVQSYVSTFVSAGLPLVIGEFGNMHSDGDPNEDAIMSTAQTQGIGYMGWSWSGNGGGVEYLDMVTGFNPAQISTWGQRIINGANGLSTTSVQCSCYSGTGGPTATRTRTPTLGGPTATRTRTPTLGGPTATRTRTPTQPTGPTATRTRTPTQGSTGSICSPVSATITAPFTKDGAGTFCWQSSNLGTFINNWNNTSVTLNGVNITNIYVASSSYPAKINGFWYINYNGPFAWSHLEVR
jgi:mannan endo-1,4-beta-mannosidase